jgi:8-oxo-dGTP diphosphatase
MPGVSTIRIRVACAVVDGEGRVLLVRHAKSGRDYWLLPGGGVEEGETIVEAGRREVREETGLDAEIGRLLLVAESIEPPEHGRHIVHLVFAATVASGAIHPGLDGRIVDAAWMPVERLPWLEMRPNIAGELMECIGEGMSGPVRMLGNVWRDVRYPEPPSPTDRR